MDAEYTNEFCRKLDEDDVNQRREKIQENMNRHFYKKQSRVVGCHPSNSVTKL
jgi:hypothetical protein